MQYREYGRSDKETLILLHGGGLSWWNYRECAERLQDEYHLILPVLDGHAGSDYPFTSIEDNAQEIISFIDENLGGSVLLIAGLSLGAQIALEILAKRQNICSYALIESAAVIPSKITNSLIAPAFGSSYGLIQSRTFAKLQFRSLKIKDDLFEDYYRDTCLIRKEDMIAFMKANTSYALKKETALSKAEIHIFYGEKETGEIRKSANLIHEKIPSSSLTILPGFCHGEFSINHPDQYAAAVRSILQRNNPDSEE